MTLICDCLFVLKKFKTILRNAKKYILKKLTQKLIIETPKNSNMKEEFGHSHESIVNGYSEDMSSHRIKQEDSYTLPDTQYVQQIRESQAPRDYCNNERIQYGESTTFSPLTDVVDPQLYHLHSSNLYNEDRKVFDTNAPPLSNVNYESSVACKDYTTPQGTVYDNSNPLSYPHDIMVTPHQERPSSIYDRKQSPKLLEDKKLNLNCLKKEETEELKIKSKKSFDHIIDGDQDENKKPNFSYVALIAFALEKSPDRQLQLNQIYKWIMEKFPYFAKQERDNRNGWKNSIRHNLSLNECFQKIPRDNGRNSGGKGHYWTMAENCADLFDGTNYKRRKKHRKTGAFHGNHPYADRLHQMSTKVDSWQMYGPVIQQAGSQYSNYAAQAQLHHYSVGHGAAGLVYSPHYSHMNQFQSSVPSLSGTYRSFSNSLEGASPFASPYYSNNSHNSSFTPLPSSLTPGIAHISLTTESSSTPPNETVHSPSAVYATSSYANPSVPLTDAYGGSPSVNIDLNSSVSPNVNHAIHNSHPGSPAGHNSPYGITATVTTESPYSTYGHHHNHVAQRELVASPVPNKCSPSVSVPTYEPI